MSSFQVNKDNALLLIVDIQERLAQVMDRRRLVTANCLHLIEAAKLLDVPILLTEQYPKGLGPTVEEIKGALPSYQPIEKITFDCCRLAVFDAAIAESGKKKIIISGMETHICVLQTTLSLLGSGYDVHVVSDAVCSRTDENWRTGLEMMRDAGAVVTCTETVLFQLLEQAGTEAFKIISKRIK